MVLIKVSSRDHDAEELKVLLDTLAIHLTPEFVAVAGTIPGDDTRGIPGNLKVIDFLTRCLVKLAVQADEETLRDVPK